MAWACGEQNKCVCISWNTNTGAAIEVRCPPPEDVNSTKSGWSPIGDPKDSDGTRGSFGGNGSKPGAPSTLPGMPINAITNTKLSPAKNTALQRLKGEQETGDNGKPIWTPTACTDLFLNSPLGMPGAQLLGTYVIFRDGTGVLDTGNVDRCGTNTAAAWTTCCNHDPVIFICPLKFNAATPEDRVKYIIHELLHVAGQLEDGNGTTGPGDPPNSGQININVDAACGSH